MLDKNYKKTNNRKIRPEEWLGKLKFVMTPKANLKEYYEIKSAKCKNYMGMIWKKFPTGNSSAVIYLYKKSFIFLIIKKFLVLTNLQTGQQKSKNWNIAKDIQSKFFVSIHFWIMLDTSIAKILLSRPKKKKKKYMASLTNGQFIRIYQCLA